MVTKLRLKPPGNTPRSMSESSLLERPPCGRLRQLLKLYGETCFISPDPGFRRCLEIVDEPADATKAASEARVAMHREGQHDTEQRGHDQEQIAGVVGQGERADKPGNPTGNPQADLTQQPPHVTAASVMAPQITAALWTRGHLSAFGFQLSTLSWQHVNARGKLRADS